MFTAAKKLTSLTWIIDWNKKQLDGYTCDVLNTGDLRAKFEAFGFDVVEVADGNDIEQVIAALDKKTLPGKPKCILAHTVKGKGVSFMENQVAWHGTAPNEEQRAQAIAELEGNR